MNELQAGDRPQGPARQGYTTILGNSSQGDYAAFQPGPGNSMGYDDLKVIEAKKFLVAVTGGEQRNSTIDEALADAEVIAAIAASAVDGQWQQGARRSPVPPSVTAGSHESAMPDRSTCRSSSASAWSTRTWSTRSSAGTAGSSPNPTDADLAQAQGAIARADALVDNDFLARTPRLRVVARTGVGVERVDLDAATARGIAVVITPGTGTRRRRRGVPSRWRCTWSSGSAG